MRLALALLISLAFGCGFPPAAGPAPKAKAPAVSSPVPVPVAANTAAPWQPPAGARKHRQWLVVNWRYYFGIKADVAVPFAQVHQESGYQEDARSQVGAAGIAQFMPATAAGLQRNVSRLRELCDNPRGCPLEPRWGLRALCILDHDEYQGHPEASTEYDRVAFMLVAYNGGGGWVRREQAACRQRAGCDPARWWGQVERVCLRADWACRESRAYPDLILNRHRPKYAAWLGGS